MAFRRLAFLPLQFLTLPRLYGLPLLPSLNWTASSSECSPCFLTCFTSFSANKKRRFRVSRYQRLDLNQHLVLPCTAKNQRLNSHYSRNSMVFKLWIRFQRRHVCVPSYTTFWLSGFVSRLKNIIPNFNHPVNHRLLFRIGPTKLLFTVDSDRVIAIVLMRLYPFMRVIQMQDLRALVIFDRGQNPW